MTRFKSLDIFRGFTLAAIIMYFLNLNTPSGMDVRLQILYFHFSYLLLETPWHFL